MGDIFSLTTYTFVFRLPFQTISGFALLGIGIFVLTQNIRARVN